MSIVHIPFRIFFCDSRTDHPLSYQRHGRAMLLRGVPVLREEPACIEPAIPNKSAGSQRQNSAALSGFKHFRRNNFSCKTTILLRKNHLEELKGHLMLFFKGFSRLSLKKVISRCMG
ncbi:hypothetical protein [Legionella sp.]|uniref:hypothetical protein n=1 Tax=Legionella sp. TaxID=459 RepID=UPI00321F7F06